MNMKCLFLSGSFCLAILVLSAGAVSAYQSGYTPISEADRKKTFPLKHIVSDRDVASGKLFGNGGRTYTCAGDDFTVNGRNSKNETWSVTHHNCSQVGHLPIDVYSGDLDRNGVEDLVIIQPTSGCGIAPSSILVTILFDRQGNPHVFGTPGYFERTASARGVKDLLQLTRGGAAILITEELGYVTWRDKGRSYWRSVLYEARKGNWNLMPNYRGNKIPLLVWFSFKPNHRLISQPSHDMREFNNLETGTNAAHRIVTAKLLEFNGRHLEYGQSEGDKDHVIVRTTKDVFDDGGINQGYLISEHGRRIASFDNKTSEDLLSQAAAHKQQIRYLKTSNSQSMPLYIWLD